MPGAATELRPRRAEGSPDESTRLRAAVVSLTFGLEIPGGARADEWPLVLDHAIRERCGPLAWLRSGRAIRSAAPALVADRWRAHALAAGERAAAQADELHALLAKLSDARLAPVVLKGQPLAVMLYGDPAARPVFDIDLFVRRDERRAAHDALIAAGWRHLEGDPPAEGTYQRIARSRMPHLELHSSLIDDALLAHLPSPEPQRLSVMVAGHPLLAHGGDSLPVFLAVHLAKHAGVPLLWWIDFATLWLRLGTAERDAARAMAAGYRLGGFLAWAERGVALLETVAHGPEGDAARALGELDRMHDRRNAFRVAALTERLTDRAAVALGWLFPPRERRSPTGLVLGLLRRLAKRIQPSRTQTRAHGRRAEQGEFARTVELTPADVASLVRQAVSAGGTAWIRVRGTSMLPTIPRIAEVLVAPVPPQGPAIGDVVLVDRPASGLLMHRVVAVNDGRVQLRGDNRFEVDRPVDISEVLAVATQLRTEGRVADLGRHPRRSLRFAAARWRTYVRRRLAGT